MFYVTGGAGFIGSNIVASLAERGNEVVVCDRLRSGEKWRNLARHSVADLVAPDHALAWLDAHVREVEAVVHMGAISATTETDVDRLVENNIRLTLDLLDWCTRHMRPFIYASSAATYGDGGEGFVDDPSPSALSRLRPLNAYGWSKHLVDRRIADLRMRGRPLPPQCVGLKFFNVFGPNEYHKGSMMSMLARNWPQVQEGGSVRLFRSTVPGLADGGQQRDFIYVVECCRTVVWMLDHPHVSGLFNLGSGQARSWLDFAQALFAARRERPRIEFIDMPEALRARYQNFTEASMDNLAATGCPLPSMSLEEAVDDFVNRYLTRPDPYR